MVDTNRPLAPAPVEASVRRTCTIPEAARVLGVSRNHAYEAAISGQLPVIVIGKRKLVPIAALERMLNGNA